MSTNRLPTSVRGSYLFTFTHVCMCIKNFYATSKKHDFVLTFSKGKDQKENKNLTGSGQINSSLHGWMLLLPLATSFCCFVQ